jgi:PAS domain S-box-containing protein
MTLYEQFKNEEHDPVVFVNKDGIITHINKSFTDTYHWPVAELVGRPLVSIIPNSLQDAHNMGFSKFLISGKPTLLGTPLDLEIRMGNGENILAQHLIVSMENNGEQMLAAKITVR